MSQKYKNLIASMIYIIYNIYAVGPQREIFPVGILREDMCVLWSPEYISFDVGFHRLICQVLVRRIGYSATYWIQWSKILRVYYKVLGNSVNWFVFLIFIICKQTNTKDIAGQSARSGEEWIQRNVLDPVIQDPESLIAGFGWKCQCSLITLLTVTQKYIDIDIEG